MNIIKKLKKERKRNQKIIGGNYIGSIELLISSHSCLLSCCFLKSVSLEIALEFK